MTSEDKALEEDELCGEIWKVADNGIRCHLEPHDKKTWHEAVVIKTENTNFGRCIITTELKEYITWEDAWIGLQRTLRRPETHKESNE